MRGTMGTPPENLPSTPTPSIVETHGDQMYPTLAPGGDRARAALRQAPRVRVVGPSLRRNPERPDARGRKQIKLRFNTPP
jgi:hypothetical protein